MESPRKPQKPTCVCVCVCVYVCVCVCVCVHIYDLALTVYLVFADRLTSNRRI